ncbi:MAG: antitoxin VapB family protein [Oceanipulchritudo sp.]
MATKTISLELDAYEKLRRAKRGGESFSAVVRRARFEEGRQQPGGVVREPQAGYGSAAGSVEASPEYWDRVEAKERIPIALESFDAASQRQGQRNKGWSKRAGKGGKSTGRGWTREDLYAERTAGQ